MSKVLYIFFTVALLTSCSSEDKTRKEISTVDVKVEVDRFDEKFATAGPENLKELKSEYPYLFPEMYHDTIWMRKMTDTLQLEIQREVKKVYSDFSVQEQEFETLFQHLKYYFPEFKEPKIITLTSDVDYRNKVVMADSLLLIGLDNFLGSEHYFYTDIPKYIVKNLTPEQIAPAVAELYAKQLISPPSDRAFLSNMIYYGKILFLKEKLLSDREPQAVIGYSDEEMEWARSNEPEIWRYFIEKELLYSSDPQLMPRFINPAPFSKFYLELDNESPGKLGQYMGWQIVRSYMENNNVTVKELLSKKSEEIFRNAKFKPRKS